MTSGPKSRRAPRTDSGPTRDEEQGRRKPPVFPHTVHEGKRTLYVVIRRRKPPGPNETPSGLVVGLTASGSTQKETTSRSWWEPRPRGHLEEFQLGKYPQSISLSTRILDKATFVLERTFGTDLDWCPHRANRIGDGGDERRSGARNDGKEGCKGVHGFRQRHPSATGPDDRAASGTIDRAEAFLPSGQDDVLCEEP